MKTLPNIIVSLAVLATCGSVRALAITYYVSPAGSDSNAGTSPEASYATPAKACEQLNGKNTAGEIVIAPGTYALSDTLRMQAGTSEARRVVVRGSTGNPEDVVLDAGGAFKVMIANGAVTVNGVTLANGVTANVSSPISQKGTAGGIAIGTAGHTIPSIVTNCIVRGCTNAYTSGFVNKAAGVTLLSEGALLVDCVVSNNAAGYQGCGITFCATNATARKCLIQGNTATTASAAPVMADAANGTFSGLGRLIDCTVQTNTAVRFAGVAGVGYIEGCTIRGNVQTGTSSGGAIHAPKDGFCMTNTVVADNVSENGTAPVTLDGANPVVANCEFSGNAVKQAGGAIQVGASGGRISDCRFLRNSVSGSADVYGGGALYVLGGVRVEDCLFEGNTADQAGGGAAYVRTSTADAAFVNCTFVSNTVAKGSNLRGGGGIYLIGSAKLTLDGCRFDGNRAATSAVGGAVMLRAQATGGRCAVSNCVFTGNYGRYGGAVATAPTDTTPVFAEFDRCTFTNNSSAYQGGAVYLREIPEDNATPFSIRNSLFAGNHSGREGGALYCASSNSWYVANCTIAANHTDGNYVGGGLCQRWGGCLVNVLLADNTTNGTSADRDWSDEFGIWQNCLSWPSATEHMTAANGCRMANPKFKGAALGDYSLKPTSPCVDAGRTESWMASASDYLGNARIFAVAPDIGCYECLESPQGTCVFIR